MTLDADNKPVVKGVENLIEIALQVLQQDAPIRVSETFELLFYDKSVWRVPSESMQSTM